MSENTKIVLDYLKVHGEINIEILSRETGVPIGSIRHMISRGTIKLSKANELTPIEKEIKKLRNEGVSEARIGKKLNLTTSVVNSVVSRLVRLGYTKRNRPYLLKDALPPTYIEITRGEHYKKRGYLLESDRDGDKMFANIWNGDDFIKVEVNPKYIERIGGKHA